MIEATLYKKPNGATEQIMIKNIYPSDEQYCRDTNVVLSLEEINGDPVVWGRYGLEEHQEACVIAVGSMNCSDAISKLVFQIKGLRHEEEKRKISNV